MKLNKTRLGSAMADKGFSIAKLANESGVDQITVFGILNGVKCRPETVGRIAQALDVSAWTLVDLRWDAVNNHT